MRFRRPHRQPFVALILVLALSAQAGALQSGSGTPQPPAAERFEGVWTIDLQASGLPVNGLTPPQLTTFGAQQTARNQGARARGETSFDLTAHCSNPGMPRIMTMPAALQIVARADEVLIIFEWNHLLRQINVDAQHLFVPEYPTAMGTSNGRWQGDRLLVQTDGRNAKTLLNDVIPNTAALRISELLQVSADGSRLTDQLTVTDPKILARPWQRILVYQRRNPPNMRDTDVCLDRVAQKERAVPQGF